MTPATQQTIYDPIVWFGEWQTMTHVSVSGNAQIAIQPAAVRQLSVNFQEHLQQQNW